MHIIEKLLYFVVGLLIIGLLLAGCTRKVDEVPRGYGIVTNVSGWGNVKRCTALAVTPRHVVTNAHCQWASRFMYASGQDVGIEKIVAIDHDTDIMVLRTSSVIWPTHGLAVFGAPVRGGSSRLFGNCPFYMSQVPRYVVYIYDELMTVRGGKKFDPYTNREIDHGPEMRVRFSRWVTLKLDASITGNTKLICGGDSGGPIIQTQFIDGKETEVVTGIVSYIIAVWFNPFAEEFWSVPGDYMANFVEEAIKSDDSEKELVGQ